MMVSFAVASTPSAGRNCAAAIGSTTQSSMNFDIGCGLAAARCNHFEWIGLNYIICAIEKKDFWD